MSGKIAPSDIQIDMVHQRTQELVHQASRYFGRVFPAPTITFRRSGKNAGTAFLIQNRINFNPVFLVENFQEYINQVIPHEVAHLIVFQVYGKQRNLNKSFFRKRSIPVKPHGEEWRHLMESVFGADAFTTHNFDTASLGIKTFTYQCGCQTIELTTRRHNRIRNGVSYRCKRCNVELVKK